MESNTAPAVDEIKPEPVEGEASPPPPAPAPKKRGGARAGAGRRPRIVEGAASPPTQPVPPFAGGPPVSDGAVNIGPTAALIMADPESLASIAAEVIGQTAKALAVRRYGPEIGATVQASDEARAEIKKALRVYLDTAAVKLTPGQNVVACVVGAYFAPVMAAEMARAERAKGTT